VLMEAKNDILALRRRNEVLEAQMGIVEVFAAALGLKANQRGESVDVAWLLQKEIDRLEQPTANASPS